MLQNFILSAEAVLPLFLVMLLGVLIRKKNWLNADELQRLNSVIFRTLFPFFLFSGIYDTELSSALRLDLLLYAAASIFLIFLVATWLVPKFVESKKTCGAMIQASYRSNFVLLGLPVVANLFPSVDLGMTAITISLLVPFYNVLAIITLEHFRGGHVSPGRIIKNIATNPLILGCLAGLLAMPLSIPPVLSQTIDQLAGAATPMALILLGAAFVPEHSQKLGKKLVFTVFVRLILIPAIFLPPAAALGFDGLAFATLLCIYATPCAVSSFVMAQQMESDTDFAAAVVVYSSLLCCFTMCLWIFLFKQLGVI